MNRFVPWLAILYVVLLPVGRSGLPMNAQWGDLVLPLLTVALLCSGSAEVWWRREDWPLGAYLAGTLICALVSVDPGTGFKHLTKQLSVALVFLVFRRLKTESVLTRRLQEAFVAALVAVTVISIAVVFLRIPVCVPRSMFGVAHTLPIFGRVERLIGLFETPEFLGDALVVAFALALGFRSASAPRRRIVWTVVATLLAAGEFLTYSHSVAGFAVAAALSAVAAGASRPIRALAGAGAVAIVLIVNAASVVDPTPSNGAADYSVAPLSIDFMGTRVEGRLIHYAALKEVAWSAFLGHPFFGVGPGRFMSETERAFEDGRLTARYRRKPPHCDLTGRLAETGILGGVSLLLLWASWFRGIGQADVCSSPMRWAAWTAVAGILVNSLNADVMNFRFLWLALAWSAWPSPALRRLRHRVM